MNKKEKCNISAAEFMEKIRKYGNDENTVILDIRTQDEYDRFHLSGAILIDFHDADFQKQISALDKSKRHLIYCRTGRRTGTVENNALDLMLQLGFTEVYNMLGGIHAFVKVSGADDFIAP